MKFYLNLLIIILFLIILIPYQVQGICKNITNHFSLRIDSLKVQTNSDPTKANSNYIYDFLELDNKPTIIHRPVPVGCPNIELEGKVIVEIIIDTTGKVIESTVIKSSPNLDEIAVNICNMLVFNPGIINGKLVIFRMNFPIEFTNQ